jgi:hypothetical protein
VGPIRNLARQRRARVQEELTVREIEIWNVEMNLWNEEVGTLFGHLLSAAETLQERLGLFHSIVIDNHERLIVRLIVSG